MMLRNATIHKYVTTIFMLFFKILELKKEIPFFIQVRLFILINLSTNKTMFAGKTAVKNRKNRQKERISGRVLKSRRVRYLNNDLTEVKK